MDPKLVADSRRTLESERERIRVELSEEVEHPRVAHGAQTAAATEVSESQRGQQLREREEHHLAQIEGALRRIEAGAFGLCQTCGKPIPGAPRGPAVGPGLRRLPRQEATLGSCRRRVPAFEALSAVDLIRIEPGDPVGDLYSLRGWPDPRHCDPRGRRHSGRDLGSGAARREVRANRAVPGGAPVHHDPGAWRVSQGRATLERPLRAVSRRPALEHRGAR